MEYTIKHSSIAAALTVTDENGKTWDCCYMAESKPVQVGVSRSEQQAEDRFRALPLPVQAADNRQYGEVFSLPIERRGEWSKAQVRFTVTDAGE